MPSSSVQTSKPTQRTDRKARKLDRQKVLDLHKQGLSNTDIALHQHVAPSTVQRFLQKIQPEYQALQAFRSGRADALSTLQAKNLAIQDKLLDRLGEEGLLNTLTPAQISGLVFALNTQHGTLYDKERLETGQSTANISTISRMIDGQVSTLYARKHAEHKEKDNKPIAIQSVALLGKEQDGSVIDSNPIDLAMNSEAGGPGGTGELLNIVDGTASSARDLTENFLE